MLISFMIKTCYSYRTALASVILQQSNFLFITHHLLFINQFTATFSDTLHNASETPFYQNTNMIYLLETIYKTVAYRLGKPKTFLD